MDEIWVAEYSFNQKAFHRQPLKQSCIANIITIINKKPNDWHIIGFGSMEQCGHIIEKVREAFHESSLL